MYALAHVQIQPLDTPKCQADNKRQHCRDIEFKKATNQCRRVSEIQHKRTRRTPRNRFGKIS